MSRPGTVQPVSFDCDDTDLQLIARIQDGLPLTVRPYADLAAQLGLQELDVITRIQRLIDNGVIKRFGIVVRHRPLGYKSNAMVVWDMPDQDVDRHAQTLRRFPWVTLCYRRSRRLPQWPFNLFCMIHGRDRQQVLAQVGDIIASAGWHDMPHAVLFSRRCFKQRGARYVFPEPMPGPLTVCAETS